MKTNKEFIEHWDWIRGEQARDVHNVIALQQQMQLELLMDIRDLVARLAGTPLKDERCPQCHKLTGHTKGCSESYKGDVRQEVTPVPEKRRKQTPDNDPLFEIAKNYVRGKTIVTASYIRVGLKISHGRASALLDQLTDAGILSPSEHGKPRKVL